MRNLSRGYHVYSVMSNPREREMPNSPRGRALVRRAGAPLPEDPRERIHALREEIAAAAAEVRQVRKRWRDPNSSAVRVFYAWCLGVGSFTAAGLLSGVFPLALLAGT